MQTLDDFRCLSYSIKKPFLGDLACRNPEGSGGRKSNRVSRKAFEFEDVWVASYRGPKKMQVVEDVEYNLQDEETLGD